MGIETVFGSAGHDHITGAQLARMVEGTVGKGDYVLRTQNELAATMQTANTVRIDTGDLVHDGRLATCERYTDLTVDSGVSGMKRCDLVVARFSKSSDQHRLVVVKGTPTAGEPKDPQVSDGAAGTVAEADMPLWRVRLDGIAPSLERVFDLAPTTASLRESVARLEEDTGLVYLYDTDQGSVSWRAVGGVCTLYVQAVSGMSSGEEWKVPGAIPARYRPKVSVYAPLAYRRRNSLGTAWVPSDANKDQSVYIYAADDTTAKENTIYGVVSWGY